MHECALFLETITGLPNESHTLVSICGYVDPLRQRSTNMVDMYSRVWSGHQAKQGLTLPVTAQVGNRSVVTRPQLLARSCEFLRFRCRCSVCFENCCFLFHRNVAPLYLFFFSCTWQADVNSEVAASCVAGCQFGSGPLLACVFRASFICFHVLKMLESF